MSTERRKSIRGLVAAWVVYWAGLAAVELTPFMLAFWRATHVAKPGSGTASVSFSNLVFSASVTAAGKSLYSGSAHLLTIAAWIAVPPLAAWAVWATRRSENRGALEPAPDRLELPEPSPAMADHRRRGNAACRPAPRDGAAPPPPSASPRA